jgi:DNA-binding transcriptional LysR family regulator
MLNLDAYRIFLHTAKLKNLTRAAEELHITQPSVSYTIKQMEEALGVKLFNRLSKGVELTTEGQALLEYVEQSFALLEAGEKKVQAMKRLAIGELRVGVNLTLFKHHLLPHLSTFHSKYPGVRIRLIHSATPYIIKLLKDGSIDCGFVYMPVNDPQIEVHPLLSVQECFVVGEAYKDLAERELSAHELAELPLLLFAKGTDTRDFVDKWFAAHGITVEADINPGSIDLLVELAQQGFGAAFVSRSFISEELKSGKLYELKLNEPILPRKIGVAVRKNMTLSPATSRFMDILMSGIHNGGD